MPFALGIYSSTGDYGYIKAGADSVTPFKSGSKITLLGSFTGTHVQYNGVREFNFTFDVKPYLNNYQNYTSEQFLVSIQYGQAITPSSNSYANFGVYKPVITNYTSSTGILTGTYKVTNGTSYPTGNVKNVYDVFCIT